MPPTRSMLVSKLLFWLTAANITSEAPMITYLCTEDVPTGRVFEAGIGFFAELQWRRSEGIMLDMDKPYSYKDIASRFDEISDMSKATNPVEEDAGGIPKQMQQVLSKM